ncbi:hypothetical protein XENOCAPTIV_022499 [Xenoophorus captivus]|uniref:Nuclear pore complex protein Nup85 n=1 Tax=Xenoophorus captivus TaxID=1517983 RepID=A0ABV0R5P0_9TELE
MLLLVTLNVFYSCCHFLSCEITSSNFVSSKSKQRCIVCVFPAGSLLLHLLDWVRLHKADVDEKARDVLQSDSPAEHHNYWDVVVSYVLQGSLVEARQMLVKQATLQPASRNTYKLMDSLLGKMPFFNEAAKLLLSLMTAKIAPQSFWMTLLTDALPLLEQTEVIFSADQTNELMYCLEELTSSLNSTAPGADRPMQVQLLCCFFDPTWSCFKVKTPPVGVPY